MLRDQGGGLQRDPQAPTPSLTSGRSPLSSSSALNCFSWSLCRGGRGQRAQGPRGSALLHRPPPSQFDTPTNSQTCISAASMACRQHAAAPVVPASYQPSTASQGQPARGEGQNRGMPLE